MFFYALKDDKEPLETYKKIVEQVEDSLDPTNKTDIDEHPNRDWLRST